MTKATVRQSWGATPEEWDRWAYIAGRDLLPAVADPAMLSLPRSQRLQHLDSLAKTPSRLSADGVIYGIGGWTAHQATPHLVAEWRAAGCYNILAIGRTLKFVDFDIPDARVCEHMVSQLTAALGVGPLVTRTRPDSGKRTVVLRLDQDIPLQKRVIKSEWGAIEFLADLQQTVLCGTHPDGARFVIENLPENLQIPVVSFERLCLFWDDMRRVLDPTGAHGTIDRPLYDPSATQAEYLIRRSGQLTKDPILNWLDGEGWVAGYEQNGTANVRCPWEVEHTQAGSPNATSWLPAGLGGKENGAFRCLHAHCEGRGTKEFLHRIGYAEAEAKAHPAFSTGLQMQPAMPATLYVPVSPVGAPSTAAHATQHETIAVNMAALERALNVFALAPEITQLFSQRKVVLETDAKGNILQTFSNKVALLAQSPQALHVRRDDFKGEEYIRLNGSPVYEEVDDDHVSLVRRALEGYFKAKVSSLEASDTVSALGAANRYDSAQEALQSMAGTWDEKPRIKHFASRILRADSSTPQHVAYGEALSWYVFTVMVGRVLSPGAKADIVPVFQSREGTGKSTLIRELALLPEWFGEINLEHKDDDVYRLMIGKVVLEWPELKGLTGRDAEAVKAFITQQQDSWVPKFKEKRRKHPRRSLLLGSTNKHQFLVDPTGNRRAAPIYVAATATYVDYPAFVRERVQYWAEALQWVRSQPSAEAAIETRAAVLRTLAAPYVAAATLPWHRREDLLEFIYTHAPGTRLSLRTLGHRLFGPGHSMNRPLAMELRAAMHQEGFEQRMPDVWIVPHLNPPAAPPPIF